MVSIRSEGCNDRGKRGSCGTANIKVNGKDYSRRRRGYNIVVVRADTGWTFVYFYSYLNKDLL